jgi:hypothetical protein
LLPVMPWRPSSIGAAKTDAPTEIPAAMPTISASVLRVERVLRGMKPAYKVMSGLEFSLYSSLIRIAFPTWGNNDLQADAVAQPKNQRGLNSTERVFRRHNLYFRGFSSQTGITSRGCCEIYAEAKDRGPAQFSAAGAGRTDGYRCVAQSRTSF